MRGTGFVIAVMSYSRQKIAIALWNRGNRWIDVPQKTRADAEALRRAYLPPNSAQ